MTIPTTIESLSTTAASNNPTGSAQRTEADDGLRAAFAFIKQLKSLATLASATTVTPPSTANAFSVTGTTAITTIASTNSWDGRDIWFVFAGILTFTHGSNLILPGSANITTAAGDCALMIQVASGQWRCAVYQRASGQLILGSPTVTGNLTVTGNATVNGNTTIGDASGDTLTIAPSAVTWSNNPTHSGVHTFTDSVIWSGLGILTNFSGAPISTLVGGSATGALIQGPGSAHLVVQLRTNDAGDSFAIVSNSTATATDPADFLAFKVTRAGNVTVPGTLAVTSTSTLTENVTIGPPASGTSLLVSQVSGGTAVSTSVSLSGGAAAWLLSNTSNTANSAARLNLNVAGTTAADPFILYTVSGTTNWSTGADNSVTGDPYGISSGTTVGAGESIYITTDGRLYGTALHNNAGAVTGTTNQYVASGTYTPTLTNTTNVAASTARACQWLRVGNVVTVSGSVDIDPTSASTLTELDMSLPIASTFTLQTQLGGTAQRMTGSTANLGAYVVADAGGLTKAAIVYFNDTNVANNTWAFSYTYVVL